MPGWENLKNLALQEVVQRRQEGYRTQGLAEALQNVDEHDEAALLRFYETLSALKKDTDFPYEEPDDHEGIMAAISPVPCPRPAADVEALRDRFLGAWYGRVIGCTLGKPFETFPFVCGMPGKTGHSLILDYLKGADAYPLSDYIPGTSRFTAECPEAKVNACAPDCLRENLKFGPEDDDVRYTVLGLKTVKRYGKDFDSFDVGDMWLYHLRLGQVCTAETQAYMNFASVRSHSNPKPADARARTEYVRKHLNPYREYLGARIRIDAYGICAAGRPDLAAQMCFEDAAFSHAKNGIYSAMYAGAMIAAAFSCGTIEEVVRTGMSYIPPKSRLFEAVERSAEKARKAKSFESLARWIWSEYGSYDWVHSINNDALLTAALVWSKGDFERGVTSAVLGGFDTDCNGATAGSILGALNGAARIPDKWKEPLHDTMFPDLAGCDPSSIRGCAEESFDAYCKYFREET